MVEPSAKTSDHTSALVPLEAWIYHSPQERFKGRQIDIGLFAEALIYYDRLLVEPTNEPQFADFVSWFVRQNKYNELISLIKDGTINFYSYSFATAPVFNQETGTYIIMNIQDEEQARSPVFEARFLSHKSFLEVLPHARQREKLHKVLPGRVIEVKAEDFGPSVENARSDYCDPSKSALLVQALLDETSQWLPLKGPSEVKSTVIEKGDGRVNITWNVDFAELSAAFGKNLNFHIGAPLGGAAHCNRLVWSGAKEACDLYLASPMSTLVGNKLYEGSKYIKNPQNIVENLIGEVEFPNVRQLVNAQEIGLEEVLDLRKRGKRFRKWLQEESGHDRNAILAYHNEVTKESGWTKTGRRSLALFGVLGGATGGALTGGVIAGVPGAIAGAAVGEGVKYLLDLASKINEGWRPVVFGNWAQDRVKKGLG